MIKYGMALEGQSVTINAISKLQRRAGINVTGVLDTETKKLLVIPRCGVTEDDYKGQDYGTEKGITERRRRKRFTLQGSWWKKKVSVAAQADLAGKRQERAWKGLNAICHSAIGQASCLICARHRQLTFPFFC